MSLWLVENSHRLSCMFLIEVQYMSAWALLSWSFRTEENKYVDRNWPGFRRSELRSRRTLMVEQTNP